MKKLYSLSMGTDDFCVTCGQIAQDAQQQLVGAGDIQAQTTCALQNMMDVLSQAGFEKHNIINVNVHLQNIQDDFPAFNQAYGAFFDGCAPSRTTIQSTLFQPQYLIEVNAMAHKNTDNRK